MGLINNPFRKQCPYTSWTNNDIKSIKKNKTANIAKSYNDNDRLTSLKNSKRGFQEREQAFSV